jgi:hypothetical protein
MWKSVSSRQLAPALDTAPPIGNRIILIAIFDREKIMAKNGITWTKCAASGID